MKPEQAYAGKRVCLNCDHWARFLRTQVGFCVEPESPMYHEKGSRGCSLHSLQVDSCSEYLEIPEARGVDRRRPRDGRQQNEKSHG